MKKVILEPYTTLCGMVILALKNGTSKMVGPKKKRWMQVKHYTFSRDFYLKNGTPRGENPEEENEYQILVSYLKEKVGIPPKLSPTEVTVFHSPPLKPGLKADPQVCYMQIKFGDNRINASIYVMIKMYDVLPLRAPSQFYWACALHLHVKGKFNFNSLELTV